MDSDFDPQRQAEAAMKKAANSDGLAQQRWIQFAQAWLALGRLYPDARSMTLASSAVMATL